MPCTYRPATCMPICPASASRSWPPTPTAGRSRSPAAIRCGSRRPMGRCGSPATARFSARPTGCRPDRRSVTVSCPNDPARGRQAKGCAMFDSLLVANRGEIAGRVIRTAREMGIRTIAVSSEADAGLPFVAAADEAVLIGPADPAQSYRNGPAVIQAALATGAGAVHPGYGFLSEDPAFARLVVDAGLIWVGPSPEAITAMADKVAARNLVAGVGVPVAPGTEEPVRTPEDAALAAKEIGYPVMIKAAAGGGGMGMAVVTAPEALTAEYEKVTAFAGRLFGDPSVFIEPVSYTHLRAHATVLDVV